jgi:hypothetical protein
MKTENFIEGFTIWARIMMWTKRRMASWYESSCYEGSKYPHSHSPLSFLLTCMSIT